MHNKTGQICDPSASQTASFSNKFEEVKRVKSRQTLTASKLEQPYNNFSFQDKPSRVKSSNSSKDAYGFQKHTVNSMSRQFQIPVPILKQEKTDRKDRIEVKKTKYTAKMKNQNFTLNMLEDKISGDKLAEGIKNYINSSKSNQSFANKVIVQNKITTQLQRHNSIRSSKLSNGPTSLSEYQNELSVKNNVINNSYLQKGLLHASSQKDLSSRQSQVKPPVGTLHTRSAAKASKIKQKSGDYTPRMTLHENKRRLSQKTFETKLLLKQHTSTDNCSVKEVSNPLLESQNSQPGQLDNQKHSRSQISLNVYENNLGLKSSFSAAFLDQLKPQQQSEQKPLLNNERFKKLDRSLVAKRPSFDKGEEQNISQILAKLPTSNIEVRSNSSVQESPIKTFRSDEQVNIRRPITQRSQRSSGRYLSEDKSNFFVEGEMKVAQAPPIISYKNTSIISQRSRSKDHVVTTVPNERPEPLVMKYSGRTEEQDIQIQALFNNQNSQKVTPLNTNRKKFEMSTEKVKIGAKNDDKNGNLILRMADISVLNPNLLQGNYLQQIDLRNNNLKELPMSICDQIALKKLRLDHNQLVVLPLNIGRLSQLDTLSVSFNQLIDLPTSLFSPMSSLVSLHLSDNKLASLNTNIGQLRKLTSLHLHSNQIVEIPVSLCKLYNINEFTLDWLNYLDKKHIEAQILRIPGRKKGQRMAKSEIGGKVFKEIAKMCRISEMVKEQASNVKIHFVQFLMYFFRLSDLEELKNINYEFNRRSLPHLLAQNGHLYLLKCIFSIVGYKRNDTSLDLSVADSDKTTPIVLALKHKHLEFSKYLLRMPEIDIFSKSTKFGAPIHLAMASREFKMTLTILRLAQQQLQKANKDSREDFVNTKDGSGNSALHLVFQYLGENINDQSQQSQTSSTQMLNNFSTDQHTLISIAKILIKEGANVNELNKAKMAPLHIAVQSGNIQAVQFALEHNKTIRKLKKRYRLPQNSQFNFNLKGGYQGLTILHFALFPTNMALSLLLLKSEEFIDLVATDQFCRKPQDLCTYSSPLFKIIRKMSQARILNQNKDIEIEYPQDRVSHDIIKLKDIQRISEQVIKMDAQDVPPITGLMDCMEAQNSPHQRISGDQSLVAMFTTEQTARDLDNTNAKEFLIMLDSRMESHRGTYKTIESGRGLGGTTAFLGGTLILDSQAAAHPYNLMDDQPKVTIESNVSSPEKHDTAIGLSEMKKAQSDSASPRSCCSHTARENENIMDEDSPANKNARGGSNMKLQTNVPNFFSGQNSPEKKFIDTEQSELMFKLNLNEESHEFKSRHNLISNIFAAFQSQKVHKSPVKMTKNIEQKTPFQNLRQRPPLQPPKSPNKRTTEKLVKPVDPMDDSMKGFEVPTLESPAIDSPTSKFLIDQVCTSSFTDSLNARMKSSNKASAKSTKQFKQACKKFTQYEDCLAYYQYSRSDILTLKKGIKEARFSGKSKVEFELQQLLDIKSKDNYSKFKQVKQLQALRKRPRSQMVENVEKKDLKDKIEQPYITEDQIMQESPQIKWQPRMMHSKQSSLTSKRNSIQVRPSIAYGGVRKPTQDQSIFAPNLSRRGSAASGLSQGGASSSSLQSMPKVQVQFQQIGQKSTENDSDDEPTI